MNENPGIKAEQGTSKGPVFGWSVALTCKRLYACTKEENTLQDSQDYAARWLLTLKL